MGDSALQSPTDGGDVAAAPPVKPVKKSFFKKPSWQKPAGDNEKPAGKEGEDDATEFFSKRNHFKDIMAEQQERQKRKLERKGHNVEKRKSDERVPVVTRNGKKPRVSQEFYDTESGEDMPLQSEKGKGKGKAKEYSSSVSRDATPRPEIEKPKPQRFTRLNSVPHRLRDADQPVKAPAVIDLEDTDSDDDKELGRFKSPAKDDSEFLEDDLEDPYLRQLAEEARSRQKQREGVVANSASPPAYRHQSATPASRATPNPPPEKTDAKVTILVHSRLENTKPLLVTIFLWMHLKQVKDHWCQEMGLSKDMASSVFLIHNGKRLYEFTTVKALGVTAENAYQLGNIEVEAVTPEIYEELKKQAAKPITALTGRTANNTDESEIDEQSGSSEKAKGIKIILKAKGLEDFKLEVKPDSTFQRIANAFRSKYKISKEQKVRLMWDGDELDPETAMQDTEIEDMDVIDIHIS